ncbi:MAG: NUDIX hydrolase [Chitinophagaceae bacterium]
MSAIVIRVYGILRGPNKEVLVSDEKIRGNLFTKFPGGGLEFGEGTRDCVVREFKEEMNLRVRADEHIYTTDFFQQSAFNTAHQIISVYYHVTPLEPIQVPLRDRPFDFNEKDLLKYEQTQQIESFRFIPWELFSPAVMQLPIDKIVAQHLKDRY